jgi:hypothetical protein
MFGALSAPQVYHWGDMYMGEQITCTGRQYLRQMIKFFMKKGYKPLVMDTDGVNFSSPDDVEDRKYIGKGNNWKVKEGKEYTGAEADVSEYNDLFMRGEMALDTDGVWPSCINIARKNYALITDKGKIKLVGNTIKSKKLPVYIEEFLDKGIKMLLKGEGKEFVEYYYEYLDKIYNKQIPLVKIAQRAKVKLSMEDYKIRCSSTTKAGNSMSRMAHMELAMKDGISVNLGDVIYYVNNGTKASHGDVQKVTSAKAKKEMEDQMNAYGKVGNPGQYFDPTVKINCYRLDPADIENNPNLLGDYNVPRAIVTFNKRLEPLMVVFGEEVRNNLIVDDPNKRGLFTKDQCKLINGVPFEEGDQDSIEDLLTITDQEMKFWESINGNPNHIYDFAEEGWEKFIK